MLFRELNRRPLVMFWTELSWSTFVDAFAAGLIDPQTQTEVWSRTAGFVGTPSASWVLGDARPPLPRWKPRRPFVASAALPAASASMACIAGEGGWVMAARDDGGRCRRPPHRSPRVCGFEPNNPN